MIDSLPDVTVGVRYGNRTWMVAGKGFAWYRPFSKADIKRFGDDPVPDGPILALRVEDVGEREAVLLENPDAFFTIAHFASYPAYLIQLERIPRASALKPRIVDAWLACAPPKLAEEYLRPGT